MRCRTFACFRESVRGQEARLPASAHTNPVRERRPDCARIRIWAQDCARNWARPSGQFPRILLSCNI